MKTVASTVGGRRRAVLPFLNTRPLHDVSLVIALGPVWWALGVEQFLPPLLLSVTTLRVLISRRRVHLHPVPVLLLASLLAYLVSALAIEESFRLLSFARSYGALVGGTACAYLLISDVRKPADLHIVLGAVAAFMTVAAVMGAAAAEGVLRLEVRAPIGELLPVSVLATEYGRLIAERTLGGMTWFAGRNLFRPSSFFLFPNLFAVALAATIPVVLYLAKVSRRGTAALLFVAAGFMLANLVLTTSRTSVVAFALGAAVWSLTVMRGWLRIMLVGCALLAIVPAYLYLDDGALQDAAHEVVTLRGPGSARDRLAIYELTLLDYLGRPVFGWGTERDVYEDQRYPAGSHSYYLGVLYRQGAVGLVILLLVGVHLWRSTRRRAREIDPSGFFPYARWSLVVLMFASLTTSLDLDVMLIVVAWSVLGAALAADVLARRSGRHTAPA